MQQHGRPHRPQAKGVGLVRRALRFGEELGTEESGSVVRGRAGHRGRGMQGKEGGGPREEHKGLMQAGTGDETIWGRDHSAQQAAHSMRAAGRAGLTLSALCWNGSIDGAFIRLGAGSLLLPPSW